MLMDPWRFRDMLARIILAAGLATWILGTAETPGQQSVPGGAKILLLSGGLRNHHGYRRQANVLQKALEDTKRFEVTICEDAAILETPALVKYDVIVPMADRRDPEF